MLSPERLATLTAVRNGKVTGKHMNAPGSPLVFEPRELTVDLKYLLKAGMMVTESVTAANRSRPVLITVTEAGNRALTGVQA